MYTQFETIITILKWLGAIPALGTFAFMIYNMLRAQLLPASYYQGEARRVLRLPYLVVVTLLFTLICYLIWQPLPIRLSRLQVLILSMIGEMIMLSSLSLYLWGMRTLGGSFNVASGFGVRLQQSHQLITNGPYAYVRHPMYLGVILVGWGGLFLYRTWTMLLFAIIMFGLIYRARREEEALETVFGDEWRIYKASVPGWIPEL